MSTSDTSRLSKQLLLLDIQNSIKALDLIEKYYNRVNSSICRTYQLLDPEYNTLTIENDSKDIMNGWKTKHSSKLFMAEQYLLDELEEVDNK